MAKPGETVGDWYTALNGVECWHTNWGDPYIIDIPSLTIWRDDREPVAGPFESLEAAKAAYLMLRDG